MAESLMSNIKDSIDHLLAFIGLSELLGLLVLLRLGQDLLALVLRLEVDEANHLVDLPAHVRHPGPSTERCKGYEGGKARRWSAQLFARRPNSTPTF